jgi:hypothetical protein
MALIGRLHPAMVGTIKGQESAARDHLHRKQPQRQQTERQGYDRNEIRDRVCAGVHRVDHPVE